MEVAQRRIGAFEVVSWCVCDDRRIVVCIFWMQLDLIVLVCWSEEESSKKMDERLVLFYDLTRPEQVCVICRKVIKHSFAQPENCKHTFHKHCLMGWYLVSHSCPMCRKGAERACLTVE